ncbi:oligosaccharide flippase family protein [Nodosilinea sp. P-1105]|uniref:lipopolysaccharide biosynthesis protein n=1 Tax=Nodosilinea sp. P-1105 TaxID=2546229 RepID=UPI001690A996|nr:oligosaccharide flippase family protein [Nodosilinea sp. P-1105]NMF82563.1 teichoic acid transporter [Nodosilinea sp. P-1105]
MNRLLSNIFTKASNLKSRAFFQDSFWTFSTKAITMAVQIVYFVAVARFLGSEDYGLFEGTKAIWAIVFPFISVGMGDILIQNVSRDSSEFSKYWGGTLLVFWITIGIALITVFPLITIILPTVPPLFILLILLADIVGLKLCGLGQMAFVANHQIKKGAQYGMIYSFTKLIAALCLPFFPEDYRLLGWGILYCVGSIVPAVVILALVQKKFGKPEFRLSSISINNIKQGFFFSLSSSASGVSAQLDRTMLIGLANPVAAGIYSAGYRFIDMSKIPIFSIQGASYARFFKYGESGIKGTVSFAQKLLPLILAYSGVALIALLLLSPFVPRLLGEEFAEASSVVIWLAPIHLLYGLEYLASDSLTGAGFQGTRSYVQVAAAFLNVGLNLYLIPIYSWRGAIWATLISESLKTVLLWIIIVPIYKQQSKDYSNNYKGD